MKTATTQKLIGLKDEIITAIKDSRKSGGVPYESISEVLQDLRLSYIDDNFLQKVDLTKLANDIISNYPEVQREIEKVSNSELEDFINSFSEIDLRNYHINSIANRINSELNINDFEFELDDSSYTPEIYFKFEIETWTGVRRFLITQTGINGVYATSIIEVETK